MKRFFRILVLSATAVLVLTACPKPEPEPGPDPKQPDVTVSLGQTSQITVDALVDDALKALLQREGDGYVITCTGDPLELQFNLLKGYDAAKPFKRYCNFPISYDFNLGAVPTVQAGSSESIDLMTDMPGTINLGNRSKGTTIYFAGIPDEIVALDAIELTEDSRFEITLSITNAFFTEGTITPQFKVDMRQFFGSPEAVDGYLQFDVPLTRENNYKATKSFRLSDVVFDPENFSAKDHNVKVDAKIGLKGKVKLDGLKTTKSRLAKAPSTLKMNAKVVLCDLACKRFEGQFSYSVKNVSKEVRLSSMPDFLALDPDKTSLSLDVESNLGLPYEAVASVNAKRNRRNYAKVDDIRFDIPVAEPDQKARGTINLAEVADVSAVLKQVPDQLDFTVGAASHTDRKGVVTLGETGVASFKPTLSFPLAFGENFDQTVTQTLSVQGSVGQALKTKQLELLGEVTNSLPVEAEMSFVLTDASGRALSREVKQTIAAGATAQVNQTIASVTSATDGLSQALVTWRFHGVKDSRPVKAADGLQASLNIKIPGDK